MRYTKGYTNSMKRAQIIQLALAVVGIIAFITILMFARLRFSRSANLLGTIRDVSQEEVQQQKEQNKNKSIAEYVLPMYCCPEAQSGKSCRLFDSIEHEKCGEMNASEEFQPGEEFQPTEAGFEACESVCAVR